MRLNILAPVAACLALAACSLPTVDKDADAKAQALYTQIRTGADLTQNADLAPDLRKPEVLTQLSAIKDALPPGAPTAVANRSWSFNAGTGGSTTTVVHAYSYPARTVLAQTVLTKAKGAGWQVAGFHVTFEDASGAPPAGPPPVTVDGSARSI